MRRLTLLLLTAAALCVGCQTSRTNQNLFSETERLMEPAPDSALLLLENYDTKLLRSRADRARYALLHSRALDRNYIDLASDSVIAPAVAYFANHGSARDKAFVNYYLGRIRENAGYSGEAAKLMLDAEKHAVRAGETKLLSMIYNCRAILYYSQYSFGNAIQMYDKADSCCRVENRMLNAAMMIKSKAKTYFMMQHYDAAAKHLQSAQHLFDSLGNHSQAAVTINTLATIAIEKGSRETDSIKRFLRDSYSKYTSGMIPRTDYFLWMRIYLLENRTDSARLFGNLTIADSQNSPDRESGVLALMSRVEEQDGNYRKATEYWNEYYKIYDSITYAEKVHLIQQVEKRYQNQQLTYENDMLLLHNRIIFWIGALIVTIVVVSFVLIIRHRRQIIRRKSEQIAENGRIIGQLKDDYSNLREQYDLLSGDIRGDTEEESNLLRALENRLTSIQHLLDIAYTGEYKPQAFYKAFKEQTTIMNRDERAFSDLQYLVNKRHCGVIDYLRTTYPALTNSEIDMLSMILFGFSFDCIRVIYNHDNVDSLYSRRTKIREKLQLPPRFRIERYLEELVEQLKTGSAPVAGQNA